jgi:WD40 repeat protein
LLAVATLFVLVLALSSVVSWKLWRAAAQREFEARENLWGALVSQARAVRQSNEMGRRARALDAVRQAATIQRNLELRNEMIAALAIADGVPRAMPVLGEGMGVFDAAFERCIVVALTKDPATVVRVSDGRILASIPGLPEGAELIQSMIAGQVVTRVFDDPGGTRNLEVWRIGESSVFLVFDDISPLGNFDMTKDGLTLAVARSDQAVYLYDLVSGAEKRRLPLDRVPARMKFDPTGRYLALYHGAFTQCAILDLLSGTCVPAFDGSAIGWSVSWSPDGTLLAGAETNQIQFWDVSARRPAGVLRRHENVITHVVISPDGRHVLSRSWDDFTTLWDLAMRQALFETKGSFVCFSPDGASIAGWTAVPSGAGFVTRPSVVDLTGDAECLLIAGRSDADAFGTNQPAFILGDSVVLNASIAHTHPDRCGMCLIDACTGRQLADWVVGKCSFPAIDREGNWLYAFLDLSALVRWPVTHMNGVPQLGAPSELIRLEGLHGAAWSADGRTVAFTDVPGQVCVLRIDEPSAVRRFACDPGARVLDVSPNGRLVAVAIWHARGTGIWDIGSGECVATLPTHSLGFAAFSPDNRRLVTGDSEALRVWDCATWNQTAAAAGGCGQPTFSPDASYIAAVIGNAIRLYDSNGLLELCTLDPPVRFTSTGLDISPDGASIVQMSNRSGIGCIWDLRRIREHLAEVGLDWDLPPYPRRDERKWSMTAPSVGFRADAARLTGRDAHAWGAAAAR